eukprot:10939262-Lingulodinium_polyedra.AAC.1
MFKCLARIEVVHSSFDQSKWSGYRFVGQIPKVESPPKGTVYRAKDLKRPDIIARRERVGCT